MVAVLALIAVIAWVAWPLASRTSEVAPPPSFDPAEATAPGLQGHGEAAEQDATTTSDLRTSGARGPARVIVNSDAKARHWVAVERTDTGQAVMALTTEEGHLELGEIPYDGSVRVLAWNQRLDATAATWTPVTGPDVQLTAEVVPYALEVHAWDVTTGLDVAGAMIHGPEVQTNPASFQVTPSPTGRPPIDVAVVAPTGWARVPSTYLPVHFNRRARGVRRDIPLARELDLLVTPGEGGLRGFGEMRLVLVQLGGNDVTDVRAEAVDGGLRLHGVASLPGQLLRVLVAAGPSRPLSRDEASDRTLGPRASVGGPRTHEREEFGVWIDEDLATDPGRFSVAAARLGTDEDVPVRLVATFGRERPVAVAWDSELEEWDEIEGRVDWPTDHHMGSTAPRGEVIVHVRDVTGRPVPMTEVSLFEHGSGHDRLTSSRGEARFPRVRVTDVRVEALVPGLGHAEAEVQVEAGETRHVELQVGRAGSILVHVRDDAGRPVRAARLEVDPFRVWGSLDERGIQHLDLFTDHRGDCLLEGVPVGSTSMRVHYGTRTASVTVDVQADQETEVTIVLPPVAKAPASGR